MGRPHIPCSVADQYAGALLGRFPNLDSPIENLDWLNRVEVVINQALAAAPDDEVADFHGAEPVDVNRGKEVTAEVQAEIGHVLEFRVDVAASGCCQTTRQPPEQEIQDRDVMG